MAKKLKDLASWVVGILFVAQLAGCAHLSPNARKLRTTGQVNRSLLGEVAESSGLKRGSSIYVMDNRHALRMGLHREISEKIAETLSSQGFVMSSANEADFYLFYEFGSTEYALYWREFPTNPESSDKDPFVHSSCALIAVDADSIRESASPRIAWWGEASLANNLVRNPRGPLELVDRLLIAVLEQFGKSSWHGDTTPFPGLVQIPPPGMMLGRSSTGISVEFYDPEAARGRRRSPFPHPGASLSLDLDTDLSARWSPWQEFEDTVPVLNPELASKATQLLEQAGYEVSADGDLDLHVQISARGFDLPRWTLSGFTASGDEVHRGYELTTTVTHKTLNTKRKRLVWRGTTRLRDLAPADPARVTKIVDLLLEATFEHLGKRFRWSTSYDVRSLERVSPASVEHTNDD